MFEWFEQPVGDVKEIVLDHVAPIIDEIPDALAKFPNLAKYVGTKKDDRRPEIYQFEPISPIKNINKSDTSVNDKTYDGNGSTSTPKKRASSRTAKDSFATSMLRVTMSVISDNKCHK